MAKRTKEDTNIGHNGGEADIARVEIAQFILAQREIIRKANEKIKDKLNQGKDNYGILKTGMRKAIKELEKTEERHQSDKEVTAEKKRIIELFADQDGQYSFLTENAA